MGTRIKKVAAAATCAMLLFAMSVDIHAQGLISYDKDDKELVKKLSTELGQKYDVKTELLQVAQQYSIFELLNDRKVSELSALLKKYDDRKALTYWRCIDGDMNASDVQHEITKILVESDRLYQLNHNNQYCTISVNGYSYPHTYYFNIDHAIEVWSERYCISPEMIEAISEVDSYMTEAYGKFVYQVSDLHALYEKYEDNYVVLDQYFPIFTTKFNSKEEMINSILDRARQLEYEHGKL